MIPDFKVCPKCGQRMVLTKPACGRCGADMPHAPGMGPAVHERSQMLGMMALLVVLLCVALVITLVNKISSPPAFVGTWYNETQLADRTDYIRFNRDGTCDTTNQPQRTWKSQGNVIQLFDGTHTPQTYVWSLNLDGKSINLQDDRRVNIYFHDRPAPLPRVIYSSDSFNLNTLPRDTKGGELGAGMTR